MDKGGWTKRARCPDCPCWLWGRAHPTQLTEFVGLASQRGLQPDAHQPEDSTTGSFPRPHGFSCCLYEQGGQEGGRKPGERGTWGPGDDGRLTGGVGRWGEGEPSF